MTGGNTRTTKSETSLVHALVPLAFANALKKALLAQGWLLTGTHPTKVGAMIGFPLSPAGTTPSAQDALRELCPNVVFEEIEVRVRERLHPRTLTEALVNVIPGNLEPFLPRSWDIVGTIAVVEGPKDPVPTLEPYWGAIGQAVIAVNPAVTSVFLKASAVGGEYRIRDLNCIAGPDMSETVHKENDCSFYLDLRKVFFSPRLVTERARVAHLPKMENEIVLDMFTGVGPFAIQRAKVQGVPIIAVDKNPVAVEYLQRNIQVNRVSNLVTPMCEDIAHLGNGKLSDISGRASRIIMNLPERAIEFLPQAVRALQPDGGIIHFYQFSGEVDPLEASSRKFTDALRNAQGELIRIEGVKIVKPYAPHEYLTVVDALCRPSFPN